MSVRRQSLPKVRVRQGRKIRRRPSGTKGHCYCYCLLQKVCGWFTTARTARYDVVAVIHNGSWTRWTGAKIKGVETKAESKARVPAVVFCSIVGVCTLRKVQ